MQTSASSSTSSFVVVNEPNETSDLRRESRAESLASSASASAWTSSTTKDIGTMSVAEAKLRLYGASTGGHVLSKLHEDKDYNAVGSWGKETDAEIQEKAKAIREARIRVADRTYLPKWALIIGAGCYGVSNLVSNLSSRFLGFSKINSKRLGWFVVVCLLLRRYAARTDGTTPIVSKMTYNMPFIGSLIGMIVQKERSHNFFLELHEAAGYETFQMNVPMTSIVTLMDVRDREYVLKANMKNFLKNGQYPTRGHDPAGFEYVFNEILGRGIFATDKKEWQDHRKIASNMFSGNGLRRQMEHVFNAHADHTVNFLKSCAKRGVQVDVQDVYQCSVFDGFCQVAFGIYPETLRSIEVSGKKPQFLASFDFVQSASAKRVPTMPLVWNIKALLNIGEERQIKEHMKILVDYIMPVIHKRKNDQDVDSSNDLLSLYIAHARKTGQAHMLEDIYLLDLILNFMVAGRDTTACLLTNITRYVAEDPQVEAKLLQAFKTHVPEVTTTMSMDQSKLIPYADALVNETLRLQPSVGNDFRLVQHEDTLPSGIKVVPGTRVLIANGAIGRDPKLWRNPNSFIPERWMNAPGEDKEQQPIKRVDEYVHPVFWGGPRLCLGKDMARFEAIVFMHKLFSQLKFELVDKVVDETYCIAPVIFFTNGLKTRVTIKEQ